MKVYVKKGEYQNLIFGIILTLSFLFFSMYIFITCLSKNNFKETVAENGFLLILALVFFCFSLFFLYGLFKKPKKFNAKLVKKNIENYKGNKITYMKFIAEKDIEEDVIPKEYTCYSYGENELIENENYIIKIKEFNWKITAVEKNNDSKDSISKIPDSTLLPIVISIGIVIFGLILLLLIFC